jgi:exonuclease VII large subunit
LRLNLLSPEHTLARGYSITLTAATGRVVRAAAAAPPGTVLLTRLHSGGLRSVVTPPDPGETGAGGIQPK